MTTLRKAMPFTLLCAALLVCLPLAAQTQDCPFTYTFTGDGTYTVANLSQNTPCRVWALTFSTDASTGGTLSSTLTFYTSPDNSTFTAVPNTVCSSTVQPPCILQGANPIVGTQGMMLVSAYSAYVRVTSSSSSGTGHGTVRGYGVKGASASALPAGGGGGGGGTVVSVATTSPILGGTITGSGTIALDTTKVPQKFFGTSAPGSVSGNLPGDLFTDTTAHNEYVCNAPAGTATPACTSVTAAGWLLLNGGGGSGTVTSVFGQTPVVDIPVTTTDISTPANPAASHTKWYTKTGLLCALDPSGVETCTGGGGGTGTVTHTGTLTANAVILGNGGVDVKPGAVLPADPTKFYNGAGAFTTPGGTSAVACPENPISMTATNTYTCTDNLGVATGKFLWCQDPSSTPVNAAVQVSWAGATINTFTWVATTTETVNCYASLGGGGGGGSSITLSTFAARPSCTTSGAVVMFSDSFYNSAFCDGANYHFLLDGMEMFPPDLAASFSSVNMSTATYDGSHGAGVIINTSDVSHNIKIRATTKPGTGTWHVILALRIQAGGGNAAGGFLGITLRNSSSGALRFFGPDVYDSSSWFGIQSSMIGVQCSGPFTCPSAFYTGTNTVPKMQFYGAFVAWIRVGEDGVNRTWDVSLDQGTSWINLVTEAVGTGLTPDQIGYFVDGTIISIAALSWKVTL